MRLKLRVGLKPFWRRMICDEVVARRGGEDGGNAAREVE